MKEKLEVYQALRNEIISTEEQRRNVWIYMYVIYISLFVLGMEWNYHLFLVTYIVIIPFQVVINDYCWSISKISTYIRLFIENNRKDINWESMHVYNEYKIYYSNRQKTFLGIVRYTGAVQLGAMSSFFFIVYCLKNNKINSVFEISKTDLCWIFLSVVLFIIAILVNQEYRKSHDTELESVIGEYRKTVIADNKTKDIKE